MQGKILSELVMSCPFSKVSSYFALFRFSRLRKHLLDFSHAHTISEVRHGLLVNMQKSVFLALWHNYGAYSSEILCMKLF